MSSFKHAWLLVSLLMPILAQLALSADEDGQAALDEALEAKAAATTLDDLEQVARLCRRALDRGLDETGAELAEQLLAATLFQRGGALASGILNQAAPPQQWAEMRRIALRDLEEAVRLHPEQEPIHRLIGRLHALPGGDRLRGIEALDHCLELLGKDRRGEQAEVYVIRGSLQETVERKLADLDKALELSPENGAAFRLRGLIRLQQNKTDEAISDLNRALEIDPENVEATTTVGLAYLAAKNHEQALDAFAKLAELQPESPIPWVSRARVFQETENWDEAVRALDKGLELAPDNAGIQLQRSRVNYLAGRTEEALEDIGKVLDNQPGAPEALALRAQLRAEAGNVGEAIADLERLRAILPRNSSLLLQLAHLYRLDHRYRRSISYFSQVLEDDAKDLAALQSRADVYLLIGKHHEAAADYESALRVESDSESILNNLAWVLATSPFDDVRDAERSVELAQRACEKSNYEAPHILSTLAAGHAENGDFEKAIEWSRKAVDREKERLSREEVDEDESILEQLAKELASYEEQKPWRELQNEPDRDEGEIPDQDAADDQDQADAAPEDDSPGDA